MEKILILRGQKTRARMAETRRHSAGPQPLQQR